MFPMNMHFKSVPSPRYEFASSDTTGNRKTWVIFVVSYVMIAKFSNKFGVEKT